MFFSLSLFQLSGRVVQRRDGPTHQFEQTHSEALPVVRGLREPVSTTHVAARASCPATAPGEGPQPAGSHDQPAAVPAEDPDEVFVET